MHLLYRKGRKANGKNTAIIHLTASVYSYATLECCHSADSSDVTGKGLWAPQPGNAAVYFEPGGTDPVTTPVPAALWQPARGRGGVNHPANRWVQGGCSVPFPAYILMSLHSHQGHCMLQLQLQFHLLMLKSHVWPKQNRLPASLQKTPTMGDKSDLLTHSH